MFNLLWTSDAVWRLGEFVNIVSGNDLLSNGTKPLPEPTADLLSTETSETNPRIYVDITKTKENKIVNIMYSSHSTENDDMETLSTVPNVKFNIV